MTFTPGPSPNTDRTVGSCSSVDNMAPEDWDKPSPTRGCAVLLALWSCESLAVRARLVNQGSPHPTRPGALPRALGHRKDPLNHSF